MSSNTGSDAAASRTRKRKEFAGASAPRPKYARTFTDSRPGASHRVALPTGAGTGLISTGAGSKDRLGGVGASASASASAGAVGRGRVRPLGADGGAGGGIGSGATGLAGTTATSSSGVVAVGSGKSGKSLSRTRRTAGPEAQQRQSCDDENGHYIVRLGTNFTSRYKIYSLMGEGTFGKVVEAWDNKRRQWVAIKIIRNIPKYRKAAEIEMSILDDIERRESKNGDSGCIHLRGYFDYRNHVCMVFKKYGLSVFDFMKENKYRGFRYNHTIDLAYQLIYSVAYLHDMDLIHTDLKPENILFANSETLPTYDHTGRERSYRLPASTAIKLIDFGSATYDHDYHSSVVSTRHYRAPEVILGLGWSFPCDIWSIGCILIELLTGEAVFQTHDNVEHLAMMERLLGPLPAEMASQADSHARKYFDSTHKLRWPELAQSKSSLRHVHQITPIDSMFTPEKRLLVDLVKKMLRFEPSARITAREALRHELFNKVRERILAYEKQQAASKSAAAAAAASGTSAAR